MEILATVCSAAGHKNIKLDNPDILVFTEHQCKKF
jgi:hypothetical protein